MSAHDCPDLPAIEPGTPGSDLSYWQRLTDQELRSEIAVDRWNLAAALHVQAARAAAEQALAKRGSA